MKQKAILMSMGLMAMTLAATTVEAQNRNCGPHDKVTAHLASKYGEARHMMGLAANNVVIEVFVSEESGTWTITATGSNGLACLVASGTDADTIPGDLTNTDPDA